MINGAGNKMHIDKHNVDVVVNGLGNIHTQPQAANDVV